MLVRSRRCTNLYEYTFIVAISVACGCIHLTHAADSVQPGQSLQLPIQNTMTLQPGQSVQLPIQNTMADPEFQQPERVSPNYMISTGIGLVKDPKVLLSLPSSVHALNNSVGQSCGSSSGIKYGKWTQTFFDMWANGKDCLFELWDVFEGLDTLTNSCAFYRKENVHVGSEDRSGQGYSSLYISAGPTESSDVEPPKKCVGIRPGGDVVAPDACIYSGRVSSKFSQKYGFFEWNGIVPRGTNLWPAFWLTNGEGWPQTGEIDVMEVVASFQERNYYTARVMVPTDDSGGWVGVSLPPNELPEIQIAPSDDEAWWNEAHSFGLNWYPTGKGDDRDIIYEFYLDAGVTSTGSGKGGIISHGSGEIAVPIKRWSLKELVKKYKHHQSPGLDKYNLPDAATIDKAVKPQHLVMNLAIGGWYEAPCAGDKCRDTCSGTTSTMIVKYVQVWQNDDNM